MVATRRFIVLFALLAVSAALLAAPPLPDSITASGKVSLDQSIQFLVKKAGTPGKFTWQPLLCGDLHLSLFFNHKSGSRYAYVLPEDAPSAILSLQPYPNAMMRIPEHWFALFPMPGIGQLPCIKPTYDRSRHQFFFGAIAWTPLPAEYEAPHSVVRNGKKWIAAQIVVYADLNKPAGQGNSTFRARVSQAVWTSYFSDGYSYSPLGKGDLRVQLLNRH